MANNAENKVLDEQELTDALLDLPDWELKGKQIVKEYRFDSYMEGIEFANAVAEEAERMNHHPDMFIGYKKVRVSLWTHKFNGITEADTNLAAKIDKIFENP